MEKYGKKDRIDAVNASLVGDGIKLSKDVIKAVLDADRDFIVGTVSDGNILVIDGVGTLKFRDIASREARDMVSGLTKELVHIDRQPEHSKLVMRITKPLADKIKEKTMGNPFK